MRYYIAGFVLGDYILAQAIAIYEDNVLAVGCATFFFTAATVCYFLWLRADLSWRSAEARQQLHVFIPRTLKELTCDSTPSVPDHDSKQH